MEPRLTRTKAATPQHVRIGVCVCFVLFVAATGLRTAGGQTAPSKEYEVKAAFLLNFAQFIQWPAAAFPRPDTPITIGILGEDPFGAALEQTFQDESVQGHKLLVKRSRQVDDLKTCHIVFISKSERDQIAQILPHLNDAGVVTVGETDQFVQRGGVINFYLDNNKVRFEINLNAAERKGLKINSQLLKRAKIVGSNTGRSAE